MFRRSVLLVVAVFAAALLPAQENTQGQLVRSLNSSLLRIHSQLQTGANNAAELRSQADQIISRRAAALTLLIEQNPSLALQLAFSEDLLATLSNAFPQSASRLESQGAWEGPVEYVILDDESMRSHRNDIRMTVNGEVLNIHFAGAEPPDLTCASILRVSGVRSGNSVAAADGNVVDSTSGSGCGTKGVQNIAVLLVTFPGVAPNVSPSAINDIFFASSGRSLDGYWREASYGQTSATGRVFGWYTLGQSYTCDQYNELRAAAIQAADADVFFPSYSRVVIVFPKPTACPWSGLGTLGCSKLSSADGSFTASTAWILSNNMSKRDQGVLLAAHERGHNLTLHHASSRDFGSQPLGPLGAAGTLSEYGDPFSALASGNLGLYSVPHKARIGWLTLGTSGINLLAVENSASFSLQPVEISPPGLQGLKVRRGSGNDAWLWLEYRQPLGQYDSTLSKQPFSGALIHYQDSTTGTHTHLLDFTPETTSWTDPALLAGKSWTDPYTNVGFAIKNATASALTLDVLFGPTPCVPSNPSVTLSPSSLTTQPGGTATYTVAVNNNDSSGCAANSFALSSVNPSLWATLFGASSLTVNPGQSASTTMTKTAPAGALGSYLVDATASSGSYSARGTAAVNVVVPPTVVISVPPGPNPDGSYPLGATVPMTASVSSGGSPAKKASVLFTLLKASGQTTTKTVATDASGKAVWNYKLTPKEITGTYSISAVAKYNGLTSTSNIVSFKCMLKK